MLAKMASPSQSLGRSLRLSTCAFCLAALLALAATAAPPAFATGLGSGGALNKLTEEQPEETEAKTAKTTSAVSSEPHNSSTVLLLGVGAAAVLLLGIVFLIMRDVRSVVPATDTDLLEGSTARHSEAAMRRRRARAKAARKQRKRNR
jgi:amino acid transporter